MVKRYSKHFERDYKFYLNNKDLYNFCGENVIVKVSDNGHDAKRAFYILDSEGRVEACREPELLREIITCKKSINLHIKMWVDGFIDAFEHVDYYMESFNGAAPKWVRKAFINQLTKHHSSQLKYFIERKDA